MAGPLDYETPPPLPPPPQPVWIAPLSFAAFAAGGLAFLLAAGGRSEGFVPGEQAKVVFLMLLSVACGTGAYLLIRRAGAPTRIRNHALAHTGLWIAALFSVSAGCFLWWPRYWPW